MTQEQDLHTFLDLAKQGLYEIPSVDVSEPAAWEQAKQNLGITEEKKRLVDCSPVDFETVTDVHGQSIPAGREIVLYLTNDPALYVALTRQLGENGTYTVFAKHVVHFEPEMARLKFDCRDPLHVHDFARTTADYLVQPS